MRFTLLSKKTILFIGITLFVKVLTAQPWMQNDVAPEIPGSGIRSVQAPKNFYDIQRDFNAYWNGKTPVKGAGYKLFKRWEAWIEPEVYPSGNMPPMDQVEQEVKQYKQQQSIQRSSTANWSPLGPYGFPIAGTQGYTAGWGAGRVNCIEFDPTNNNVIWIGTPAGGIWKSADGGNNWSLNNSFFQTNGVSDIAIAPSNNQIVYLATGDADEGAYSTSRGVYKSTDGGNSWNFTGLTYQLSDGARIYKLLVHPTNPNIVIAATNNGGIWRTTNGGTSWTKSQWYNAPGNNFYTGCVFADIEFKPGDPNTVYAALWGNCVGYGAILRSSDGGATFNYSYSLGSGIGRISLGVTAADPNVVYALVSNNQSGFHGLFKSTNSGTNFSYNSSSPNLFNGDAAGAGSGGQGDYDNTIAVHPTNANEIYVGGVNYWKSSNGGLSWTKLTHWNNYNGSTMPVVHADVHAFEFQPGTTTLYTGNDGGIYKTTDGGITWAEKNNGINTHLFERISDYDNDPGVLVAGAQDNSSFLLKSGIWKSVMGTGDGEDNMIDYTDSKIFYTSYQNGELQRTLDGGLTFNYNIKPAAASSGAWCTPMIMNLQDHNTIYAGYERVYKSTNKGDSWTAISWDMSGGTGARIKFLAIDNTGNTIYSALDNKLYKTTNAGGIWNDITSGLPVASAMISRIYCAPNNGNNIWVTFSGYTAGQKVYFSNNGGTFWSNISGTLPNVPMQCILYDINNTDGATYLGSNIGVFYRDNTMNDWVLFNDGLDDIPIKDLEINTSAGKLRAATRGRGVWETPITTTITPPVTTAPCEYSLKPLTDPILYSSAAGGLEVGHNGYLMNEYANYFDNSGSKTHVMGAEFNFGWAETQNLATAKITAKVYKNDGSGGKPGTVLATKDILISTIIADINSNNLTKIDFNTPVPITGPYYLGFEVYYVNGDTVALRQNVPTSTTTNYAWLKWNGNWQSRENTYGGRKTVYGIYAVIGSIPTINYTSNIQNICPGGSINFTNSSLNGSAFEWTFTGGTPSTSSDYTPAAITYAAPGTYSVKLKALGSCNGKDSVIKTNYITVGTPVLTTNAINVNCSGGNNGAIDLSVTGGPYTYSWAPGGQTTEDVNNLSAGTYTVTVTAGAGCTANKTVTITQPTALAIAYTQTNVSCNGGNNGSIVLTVTGGTAPYTYLWSNGQTTKDISNLTAGTYSVTVTGVGGCTATKSITITQPATLTASASSTNASCGNNNGSVTLTVNGGTAPYTYTWSNGTTTQNISNLGAGTYSVTVTDAKGCTKTANSTVTQPGTLTANVTSVTNVSCNAGNTGAINISVTGGSTPYSYSWSNGATTEDISGLAAGTYIVTVTDNTGCSYNRSIPITQPPAVNVAVTGQTNVSCNGGTNGNITILASGGTAPYTYAWSNGATTKDLINLASGLYTVTVTATGGCTATTNTTISQPTVFTTSMKTNTPVSCNGSQNGALDINVAGGTTPYTFAWSNGATTEDITNLASGTYNLTATDKNGCISILSGTVTQPNVLIATLASTTNPTCTSANNGAINVSVNGGTTPYTYAWSNGATTQNLTGIAAGLYSVTVTDAKGCQATVNATLTAPAALAVTVTSKTDATCNGTNNGSININATGGTTPYTYAWSNGATTQNINGLGANSYTVTVTSQGGCTANTSATITQPSAITISLNNKTNVSCNGANNGAIDVTVSGGTAPYTYSWSNGATTQDISGLNAGTYTLTVSGAGGNCVATFANSITQPPSLSATVNAVTPATCGTNNGTIDISVAGGTGSYTYLWSNGGTTQDLTGLSAGSYSVKITDANGCFINKSADVTQPGTLDVLITSITHVSCNGGNNGAINITATGGTPGYTYSWSNLSTTEDLTNLGAGTYSVTVTDNAGCVFTKSVTINQPAILAATIANQTNVSCNGGSNGAIDLSVAGGTAPYTYAWSNSATTQDITGLTANNYSVTVTSAGGCTATANATINAPTMLSVANMKTNVSCNGGSNGSIDLTVTGGVTPYTYSWNNGVTTEDMANLTTGTYVINVTDANGCVKNSSISISQPTALNAIIVSTTNAYCNTNGGGSIDLAVTGGTGSYTYMWSNGSSVQDPQNLTSGSYTVTVTDSLLCTVTKTANVTQPQAASISVNNKKNVDCNAGSNGAIDINVTGGIQPYTYSWSNGATTQDINGLMAGSYVITVSSGGGCNTVSTITLTEPSVLTATAIATNATCNGGNNGAIALTVGGGVPPYTYVWTNSMTAEDITGLTANTYSVTVKDANNCTKLANATVSQPTPIAVSIANQVNVTCGANNGSINITATDGTAPYTYLWSNGATTEDVGTLSAGAYTVTVKDANNCIGTASTTITQPSTLSATVQKTDVTCNGNNDGIINITPTGGTSPYTYSWSNGATTEDLSNLAPGSYNVTITDATSCTYITSTTITQPNVITSTISAVISPDCHGGSNGSINLTVSGGTIPYAYLWSDNSNAEDPSNLIAGNYSVVITDANGCTSNAAAGIIDPAPMAASIISQVNTSCHGGTNGAINLGITGSTPPYTYNWSNGSSTEDLNNLSAGIYNVSVTSAKGCTANATATITQPVDISITVLNQINVTCNGGNNGAIDIKAFGGTAPYTYLWSNGETTEDITGLVTGSYTVSATDATGCTKSNTINITESNSILITTTSQIDPSCNGNSDGSIDITVTGGTGPYTYSWSNSAVTEDISTVAAGTYSVTVTDASNCTKSADITLMEPDAVSVVIASQTDVKCNGGNNGAISLAVSGGTGSYTYLWTNTATTRDILNLSMGGYTVTVTDSIGCTGTANTTISEPVALSISTPVINNVSTCIANDGSISVTANDGTAPYTYLWNTGATTSSITNQGAGTYNVTVTDANACTANTSATITQPSTLAITVTNKTDVTCNGNADGSIDITVTGGTTAYNYSWSNASASEDISGLAAGTYNVTVTDAASCTLVESIVISEPQPLSGVITVANDVSCNGGNDGDLNLTVTGGTSPYTYSWNTSATTQNITGVSAGTYDVTITDNVGCTANASYMLADPAAFNVTILSVTDATCNGASNGAITIGITGGTAPFTYNWTSGATTQNISGAMAGEDTVTVTDAKGCIASADAMVSEPAAILINHTANNVSVNGGNDGDIDITVSGGTSPYTFAWSNNTTNEDPAGLIAGTYTITVTDANTCEDTLSVTITQPGAASYCSGTTTLTAAVDTLEDGSGNNAYGTDADCYWLIQPSNAANIILNFMSFSTENNVDYVTVYDGDNTSAAVLGMYSGNNLPYSIQSTGGSMLIHFTSNSSVNDSGFVASYTSQQIATAPCSGVTPLTAASDAFADGSSASQYNEHSNCKWLIQPAGATRITLKFNSFDTENGYDFVTVYDGPDSTANILGQFTGTFADSVVSTGGSMLVHFTSDYSVNGNGWDAEYYSSNVPNTYCTGTTTFMTPTGSFGDGSNANDYGPNSDCSWLIQPTSASSITLSFSNFDIENGNDSVFVYDGTATSDPLLGVYTGNTLPSDVTSSGGNMLVRFISDNANQKAGWFANYNAVLTVTPFCSGTTTLTASGDSFSDGSGTNDYVENSNCSWLIQPTGATSITLSFNSFDIENGYDYVYVYEGIDANGTLMGAYTGNNLPPSVTAIGSSMFVLFSSDYVVNGTGWDAQYTSSTGTPSYCNGTQTLTAPSGTFNDGSGPNNYLSNADCYWLIQPSGATSITVDFTSFDTEYGYDSVYVYDGATTADALLGEFTGNTIPSQLISSTGSVLVHFKSDVSVDTSGWEISYNAFIPIPVYCSGTTTMTSITGTFSDGSGANNYNDNTDCSWLIQPAGASTVALHFTALDVENGYDFVYVYDGADTTAPLLGAYTGSTLPTEIFSTGPSMFVNFKSDYIYNASGWDAYYDTMTTVIPFCNGTTTITAASGSFSDGSGTDNYTNFSNCSWLIQPAGVSNITLSFSNFDTEKDYDYVLVYDGTDTSATLIGVYTGDTIPSSITSSGGSMFVWFYSDNTVNATGWDASYTTTTTVVPYCSGTTTLTAANGSFEDGSSTNNYVDNSNCSWLIQPAGTSSISLTFNSFDTENGYDSVYVYDGADASAPLLGGYTGNSIPPTLTSTGGSMFVWFHSDNTVNATGWDASYTSATAPTPYCSGTTTLTAASDNFSDGSGTNNYIENSDCSWLIQPSGATSITLTFNSFDTENGFDSVYVYDGVDATATLLGGYSGSSIPSAITSAGGSMFVRFHSDNIINAAGWDASYTSSSGSTPYCSGTTTLIGAIGSFSDGSGTNNYVENSDCSWLIQPAGATSITLTFNSFDTENGFDSVYVYDGIDTTATLLGGYTGNSIPSAITSTSGSMFVKFHSDNTINTAGWDASYTSAAPTYCSGTTTLTSATGSFADGSASNNYSNNSNCSWLIQPVGATSITLTFNAFNTQNGYDSVYVYDGEDATATLLGGYTGTTLPPVLTSSGGSMYVLFHTDNSITAAGWWASYTSVIAPTPYCSGITTLTAANGSFDDGSGANNYIENSDCSWLIQPAGAASISLIFNSFDTETNYDSVYVYDGVDATAPLLGGYTGTTIPPSSTSTGGSMFVRFHSDNLLNAAGWDATYSSTTTGINHQVDITDIQVVPNPTLGAFTYYFSTQEAIDVTIELVDVLGQIVWKDKADNVIGKYAKEVNITDLQSGIYMLHIQSGNKEQIRKVFKQ